MAVPSGGGRGLPLLLLAGAELALRLGGYGYATSFFKKTTMAGQEYFIENDQFSLRFFPAALARVALPVLVPAKKAPEHDPGFYSRRIGGARRSAA